MKKVLCVYVLLIVGLAGCNHEDNPVKYETVKPTGLEMVLVEGGTFTMGSNEGNDDSKPAHDVTVTTFYIGKYEVTQKLWVEIMGTNPSDNNIGDSLPVVLVSWDKIQEFLRKLNEKTGLDYRLPTEAEWEFAARGGLNSKGYFYSGSNNLDEVAWIPENSGGYLGRRMHEVGTKKPNELGIYDMSGNVFEWCSDWYKADYYMYSTNNNPKGPENGDEKVQRGGAFGTYYIACGIVNRARAIPSSGSGQTGLRLARDFKMPL